MRGSGRAKASAAGANNRFSLLSPSNTHIAHSLLGRQTADKFSICVQTYVGQPVHQNGQAPKSAISTSLIESCTTHALTLCSNFG
jgi:hypothetical protein